LPALLTPSHACTQACPLRRLLVSVTDFGIRVLAMPGACQLLHLAIHTNNVHILECHPQDPALAFSASYDGTLQVWDTRSGAVLKKFSSRHTRPDGRSWPDAIPFADGHWAPDGASITVTDVAGQLHRFALGGPPPCPLARRAPYDQFFSSDYSPLLRDLHHNVLDAETQLPPHLPEGVCVCGGGVCVGVCGCVWWGGVGGQRGKTSKEQRSMGMQTPRGSRSLQAASP
jgi:hypothetical protein